MKKKKKDKLASLVPRILSHLEAQNLANLGTLNLSNRNTW